MIIHSTTHLYIFALCHIQWALRPIPWILCSSLGDVNNLFQISAHQEKWLCSLSYSTRGRPSWPRQIMTFILLAVWKDVNTDRIPGLTKVCFDNLQLRSARLVAAWQYDLRYVGPWWCKTNPKASGLSTAPLAGHAKFSFPFLKRTTSPPKFNQVVLLPPDTP